MKIKGKKISAVTLGLLGIIAILSATAFALFYMSVTTNFSFHIATSGKIAVYQSGTTTPLTSYTFSDLSGLAGCVVWSQPFDIVNTGNAPVNVSYNPINATMDWFVCSQAWFTTDGTFALNMLFNSTTWYPSTQYTLNMGQKATCQLAIVEMVNVQAGNSYSFSLEFDATSIT